MDTGKPIFAQIMDFLPTYEFHQCVRVSISSKHQLVIK